MGLFRFISDHLLHRSKLTSTEALVLSSVEDRLPELLRERWRRQVEEVDLVQRHYLGREVNLYGMLRRLDESVVNERFPNHSESLLIARVRLVCERCPTQVCAYVWSVRGVVFSIMFDRVPPTANKGVHVQQCDITADLLRTRTVEYVRDLDPEEVSAEHLAHVQLLDRQTLRAIRKAVPPLEYRAFLSAWEDSVPSDYAALAGIADGFFAGNVEFLGTRVRFVVSQEVNLLVLADLPNAVLYSCYRSGAEGVYLLDFELDQSTHLSRTFLGALLELTTRRSCDQQDFKL